MSDELTITLGVIPVDFTMLTLQEQFRAATSTTEVDAAHGQGKKRKKKKKKVKKSKRTSTY